MNIERILRFFIIFLAIYLLIDGTIHLLNIRLQSVAGVWPQSAIAYGVLLNTIYSSFVFLAAGLILIAQKDLKKYKNLFFVSGIWAFFHGSILIFLTFTQGFSINFANLPSLYVWIPFYDYYLLFEAFLAFVYTGLIFIWFKRTR